MKHSTVIASLFATLVLSKPFDKRMLVTEWDVDTVTVTVTDVITVSPGASAATTTANTPASYVAAVSTATSSSSYSNWWNRPSASSSYQWSLTAAAPSSTTAAVSSTTAAASSTTVAAASTTVAVSSTIVAASSSSTTSVPSSSSTTASVVSVSSSSSPSPSSTTTTQTPTPVQVTSTTTSTLSSSAEDSSTTTITWSSPADADQSTTSTNWLESSTTTSSTTAAAQTSVSSTYQQSILDAHNTHRANASVPNLTWSANMASIAQQIAASCVYAHNTQAGGGGYGQNIGAGVRNAGVPALINNLMYNAEIGWYPLPYGKEPDMSNFEHWGHYSQIVWKSTTQVGCYTQDCSAHGLANVGSNTAPFFTVCNYSPPGNFGGQYAKNVLQPGGAPTITL